MSFLNPFLFVALAAAAIPVIIHLINFRKPRQVAFSTLAFFQELQKSTIRRLNLKRYLLLALRVLAIAMLAFALARPFIPSEVAGWFGSGREGGVVAIMIDNGPSMMQVDESGPYMDQARRVASEIIAQSGEGARFLLVPTHGDMESARLMRAAEAESYLDHIEPVNKGAYPDERMAFIHERIADEPGQAGRIYWISDARKTQLDRLEDRFKSENPDAEYYPVTFIRMGNESFQNVAVVAVDTDEQILGEGIPVGISVNVRNFGGQAVYNSYLSLEIDGERIGQYEVDLEAGQEKELLFEVIPDSPGSIRGQAILEGGTYTFDHNRYFSLEVPESRNVLLIFDEGEDGSRRSYLWPALTAASETGTRIHASRTDISNVRDHNFNDYDAVILEGPRRIPDYLHAELVQFAQQGRGLLFVPSEQGNTENYNRFLQQFQAGSFTGMRGTYGRFEEVASLQAMSEGHLLIDDIFETRDDADLRIDMPSIYHYWRYQRPESPSGTTLLRSNLDEPLFIQHGTGDGMILVGMMGFGPGWSNLSIKPIYAPLVYRMMLYVVAWEDGGLREHILGSPFDRNIADYGSQVRLTLNSNEIRPETAASAQGIRITYPAREWSPGWLELRLDDREYIMGVNQDISESDFASLSLLEVEEFLENILPLAGVVDISGYSDTDIRSAMASVSFGREIWNWFIMLALAFMVAECIISKKYRTETSAD